MELSDYLPMFLAEGREHLQALNEALLRLEREPGDAATIDDAFRVAHTLKGMSATMGFTGMAALTHELESVMEGLRGRADDPGRPTLDALFASLDALEGLVEEVAEHGAERTAPEVLVDRLRALAVPAAPAAPTAPAPVEDMPAAPVGGGSRTVRVDAERLDLLLHLMGEMVVQRTRLEARARTSGDAELQGAVGDLTRVAQALQRHVMHVRMVPVASAFLRFPRMVRDIAAQLGKTVELRIAGEDTELDRTVVEALGDPLVHLVRNALDHGLETPAERTAAGKPAAGLLELSAEHAGGEVVIRVREDGRGIDPDAVGLAAVQRGLIDVHEAAALRPAEAIELLFRPGFSTTATTTDLSGRGVGMDAVRAMVRRLGGDCTLESRVGEGTTATLRLPLSLAILPALLVDAAGAPYALPLDRVEQTLRLADHAVRPLRGGQALVLRDRVLRLHDLGVLLGGEPADPTRAAAVVCRAGGERVGLVVERLVGQQELVTRPLPAVSAGPSPVAGGAVLGDGRIALIVDIDTVAASAREAA